MVRTGTAVMKAEAIASVPALGRCTRRNRSRNGMGWAMNHDPIPIHVAPLLDQLGGAVCDALRPLLRAHGLGLLAPGRRTGTQRQHQKQANPHLHIPLLNRDPAE